MLDLIDTAASLSDLAHERQRRSLAEFVRAMWPVVEPGTPLVWNWHLDILCDELEHVTRGQTQGLVICVPPGTMKSLLVSVFWGAWEWLEHSEIRAMFLANEDALVKRDSRRTREVLTSDEYRALLKYVCDAQGRTPWQLAYDQNEKTNFENDDRGFRQCLSIGARVTGKRADKQVIDDPYDAKDALRGDAARIAERMYEVVTDFHEVLESRLNDRRTNPRVVIMQRLHPDDLAGVLIRDGWRHVVLPMEWDPAHPYLHPDDPRTEPGELLFPERFPRELCERVKARSMLTWMAQYQQLPSSPTGGLLRRASWRRLPRAQMPALADMDHVWAAGDMAFTGTARSDYTVYGVLARKGATRYVLDVRRGRWEYSQAKREAADLKRDWPAIQAFCVEDKANAHALLSDMRDEIDGLQLVRARDGKVERAQAWSHLLEAEQIVIPEGVSWADALIDECAAFPNGSNDDQVDMLGHGLIYDMQRPSETDLSGFAALGEVDATSGWSGI